MENKIKYLEMITRVIERMSDNSFKAKEWCITSAVVISGLSISLFKNETIFVSMIPLLAFWVIDAYYLSIEKNFRLLYELVCADKVPITFSMNYGKIIGQKKLVKARNCFFEPCELYFYMPLCILLLLVIGLSKIFVR